MAVHTTLFIENLEFIDKHLELIRVYQGDQILGNLHKLTINCIPIFW